MYRLCYFLLLSFSLASCQPETRRTASGLEYRVVEKGKGELATSGSTVKVEYTWHFHDTLVRSTYFTLPHYQALIPGVIFPYDPMEVLVYGVREGDSLDVILRADSLAAQGKIKKDEPNIKPEDFWRIGIRVVKVYPFDMLKPGNADSLIAVDKKADWLRFVSMQSRRGPERIKAYLEKKKISAEWNPEGLAIEWIEKGKGSRHDSGAVIKLNYHLTTLQGRLLDSNRDTSFHHPSPLEIRAGTAFFPEAIDKTLASLPTGSRARIYVPVMKTKPKGMEGDASVEDWVMEVEVY